MNICKIIIITIITTSICLAQEIKYKEIDLPFILSTGKSEVWVEPDKIIVYVKIDEELIKKKKQTIDDIESEMMQALTSKGINNIQLADADFLHTKLNWFVNKRNTERDYFIELQNVQELNTVFEQLSQMQVQQAEVAKYSYSKADSLIKVLHREAAINAKTKAEEIINAVGEELGDLLYVDNNPSNNRYQNYPFYPPGSQSYYLDGMRITNQRETNIPEHQLRVNHLRKLHFSASVTLKYQIKQK